MFELDEVVPWGRTLEEYQAMFCLDSLDRYQTIAGFGDGPASFNCEATQAGFHVTSFDPLYQCSRADIERRIATVRDVVMAQMAENQDNYVWTTIHTLDELEATRMNAMRAFLEDYEQGRAEGRYVCHELPDRLPYEDGAFDLGLSSHFLLMYTTLGYEFHLEAIDEMLRVCKEVRIFPLVDLDANPSPLIERVIDHYRRSYQVSIVETSYEFQKGANHMLVIKR